MSRVALRAALASSLLTVIMGVALGFSQKIQGHLDSSTVSLLRVLMNGVWVLGLLFFSKSLRREVLTRKPDADIVLWALFGCLTVHSYTYAVLQLGMGMATLLLQTFQVLGVALMAPFVAGGKWTRSLVYSFVACIVGLILLKGDAWTGWDPALLWGAFSGVAAALAYLMLTRSKERFSGGYAMFYWTIFGMGSHLVQFVSLGTPVFPQNFVLFVLILAGLLAAGAQFLTARAYQNGSAMRVTLLLYLAPIVGLSLDSILFGHNFGVSQALGTGLVIFTSLSQMKNSESSKRNDRC